MDFSKKSINFLGTLAECKYDEIMNQDIITIYLQIKWNKFGYKFYLAQFFIFISMLTSLIFLFQIENDQIKTILCCTSLVFVSYTLIYELIQIGLQKLDYFKDFINVIDLFRIALIYLSIFDQLLTLEMPDELHAVMFTLIWFKILTYLAAFKPMRYLIQMIFDILYDIRTFLMILLLATVAYSQILLTFDRSDAYDSYGRIGYLLAFGELSGPEEFGLTKFIIFGIFAFIVPLVMMNLLIALMSDSYARIQSNARAADNKSLAAML